MSACFSTELFMSQLSSVFRFMNTAFFACLIYASYIVIVIDADGSSGIPQWSSSVCDRRLSPWLWFWYWCSTRQDSYTAHGESELHVCYTYPSSEKLILAIQTPIYRNMSGYAYMRGTEGAHSPPQDFSYCPLKKYCDCRIHHPGRISFHSTPEWYLKLGSPERRMP